MTARAYLILILSVTLAAGQAMAASRIVHPSDASPNLAVRSVVIQGNSRTKTDVIRAEVTTTGGQPFSAKQWSDDVQRVKDLGIFWTTETTAAVSPAGIDLYLTVEDKWTVLPLFGFTRTEDTTEWTTGLYDANFLGRNMQFGFQFTRKRNANGIEVFYWAKRVPETFVGYYVEYEASISRHPVFDDGAESAGSFERYRKSVYAIADYQFNIDRDRRLELIFNVRQSRYEPVDPIGPATIPDWNRSVRVGTAFTYGRLHYDDYIYRGSRWNAGVILTDIEDAGVRPRWSASYEAMYEPFARHNAGYRLFLGQSSSERFDERFFLGGLEEVRGFPDERFQGANLWLANAEYRLPWMDNRYLLGQLAAFADAGQAWSGELKNAVSQPALSAGGGIRVIVKPIIGSMIRIDIARTLSPQQRTGLNLGIEQFF